MAGKILSAAPVLIEPGEGHVERHDIGFDESDKNLFQVEDARLRADALRHSILPRLHLVMNEAIAGIRNIYGVDVLEDSIVTYWPHFRTRREADLTHLYDSAFVGIGGRRVKEKWFGVARKDGKPVQILPFRFGMELTVDGLSLLFDNHWLKGLTDASYEKYLDFHLEFEGLTHRLCYFSGLFPELPVGKGARAISTFREHYLDMKAERYFANRFFSVSAQSYPVSEEDINQLIWALVFFFPAYDSYIQISKGEPVRFLALIAKANDFLDSLQEEPAKDSTVAGQSSVDHGLQHGAAQLAAQRVRVMPALRWQVFQRDRWKCVACGRGSHDDVILHVDHILPRSRGGTDSLENFQTLCDRCNIGKSNRDDTDLRACSSDESQSA